MTDEKREEIKRIVDEIEAMDLPDGAYWAMLEERGVDPEDVIEALDYEEVKPR